MRVRFQRSVRKMVRRISNGSWALGGIGLGVLLLRKALIAVGIDPPFDMVNMGFVGVLGAGALAAFSRLFWLVSSRTWTGKLSFFPKGRIELKSALPTKKGEIAAVLRGDGRVFVVLKDATILSLRPEQIDDWEELDALLDAHRGGRMVLEPEVRGGAAIVALSIFTSVCGAGMVPQPDSFALMAGALVLAFIVSARVALKRRGLEVVLGLDGIRFGKTFVAYADIERVISDKRTLVLVRRDGTRVEMLVPAKGDLIRGLAAEVRHRAEDIYESGTFAPIEGESMSEWIARLGSLLRGRAFRDVPADKAKAEEVVRAPSTPRRVRVALAAALDELDAESAFVEELREGCGDEALQTLLDEVS